MYETMYFLYSSVKPTWKILRLAVDDKENSGRIRGIIHRVC